MKKLGLAILSVIAIAAIYYYTSGSTQLTIQMKEQVDAEIASLQTQGFSVEGKEISEEKEHFIISIDEPSKVATYLNAQGLQTSLEDMEALKGAKVGIDVSYLADAYSAASFDIYPVALPFALTSASLSDEDKKAVDFLQKLVDKKAFLLHVDVNKLGNGFKGYLKDIQEVIDDEGKITVTMEDLKFSGDLKDDKLSSVKQTLKNFTVESEDAIVAMQINNLTSNYALTGTTKYDYITDYSIEDMSVSAKDEFDLRVANITMNSASNEKNGLASVSAATKADTIHFIEGQKLTLLKTLSFDMKANNFDMKALEKLETIDPENEQELMSVFQGLISHGIRFEIPNLSVKEIEIDKQKLDGFKLTSTFDIDKSLDLASLEQNPMAAIGGMNADIDLTLSGQLFGLLAQHPQAVMVMMLIQPKDVNGKKVYKVELKNGKLSVNGKPIM